MENTTCIPEFQKHISSTNFRIASFCALSSILGTFVISVTAMKWILEKSIFQSSTGIILFFNLIYANIHQMIYAYLTLDMVYKGLFLLDKTCEWMHTELECVPFTVILYIGIGGMIYSQTGVLVERAFATFCEHYTTSLSRCLSVCISTFVLVLSVFTYRIILWDDPLDKNVVNCFTPAQNSSQRANRFLFICSFLTFFNLIASAAMMYYNKMLEYSIRYKVQERFKKRECIDSTHTICVVSMSQFVTMLMYSLGLLFLRNTMKNNAISSFLALVSWVYTVPYTALLFPLILIYRIREIKRLRVQKIQWITSTTQTQQEHIEQIAAIWNMLHKKRKPK